MGVVVPLGGDEDVDYNAGDEGEQALEFDAVGPK